ncbi:DNA/RNA non-specific endonuclease [Dokdonia sp.]|uniref:DNA/RNA non-specific endonuclease n=1 Tax=Dokdonia sp. TaxID=2024995 RepID=UPI003266F726
MAYSSNFLGDHIVEVPTIHHKEVQKFDVQDFSMDDYYLDYSNYSVFQSPFRKFPYYTAANIDGSLFKSIKRADVFSGGSDSWKKDERIPKDCQLGKELYSAEKSNFDKGHLTKREDVQWGENTETARSAAASTFYFTNAVPQVDRLNRGVWRRIEDYILHHEVVKQSLKISMMTGPLLLDNDPDFVTDVNNTVVQIPTLFYKVIYYVRDNELHRTGFLTSQKGLLEQRRIVKPVVRGEVPEAHDPFLDFKDAETYQVRVSFIEDIGKLKFAEAKEVFVESTPEELILDAVDVRSDEVITTRSRSRSQSRNNLKL